jgi:phage tail-like protein
MPKTKVSKKMKAKAAAARSTAPPAVKKPVEALAHIASRYNAYPGEEIIFSTRLQLLLDGGQEESRAEAGWEENRANASRPYTLTVLVPQGLELLAYDPAASPVVEDVFIQDTPQGAVARWRLAPGWRSVTHETEGTQAVEFTTRARVVQRHSYEAISPFAMHLPLVSQAMLRDAQGMSQASASLQVMVHSQSKLMSYLPEVYAENEFLGRFMMIFESFWRDMELQIDHSELYYLPGLAPVSFLPWLGSWIGFDVDEDLPEARKRGLLAAGLSFFRRRGTCQALQEYLQIYTGCEVRILEHRGQNLVLGPGTRMGVTAALGTQNRPHTFSVRLNVCQPALLELYPDYLENKENVLKMFHRRVENLINSQKPAHTDFDLMIQVSEDEK